jgi:hypothetical protein
MNQPVNPYASPTASATAPPAAAPHTTSAVFRPASGRATLAVALTLLSATLQLLLIGSLVMQLLMLQVAKAGAALDPRAADFNDQRQSAIAALVMVSMLANFIALLVWIYAAHKNLPALVPSRNLEISPGWAVGWFFIPIMNLFKPFQAMRQLWNESDPAQLQLQPDPPSVLHSAPPVTLVGWWWGLRIVSNIAGRVFSVSSNDPTIDDLIFISASAIALVVFLDIPVLMCQWQIIRTIQRNQERRYAKIELVLASGQAVRVESGNPFAETQAPRPPAANLF